MADILGCSLSSVKAWVKAKRLHPQFDEHGDYRFDPAEIHAFANGRREKRRAKQQSVTGQIAARVYKLLDKLEAEDRLDVAHREIVRRVKIDPDEAQRLFQTWLLPFGEALAKQREAEEQAERERLERRAATLEAERLRASTEAAKADASMFAAVHGAVGRGRRKGGGEQ